MNNIYDLLLLQQKKNSVQCFYKNDYQSAIILMCLSVVDYLNSICIHYTQKIYCKLYFHKMMIITTQQIYLIIKIKILIN